MSLFAAELEEPKIGISGKGLSICTHSVETNNFSKFISTCVSLS